MVITIYVDDLIVRGDKEDEIEHVKGLLKIEVCREGFGGSVLCSGH